MSSSKTDSSNALHGRSARKGMHEETTRIVKRLMARQAVLNDAAHGPDESTDTIGVMLRLAPEPRIILMVRDATARTRIALLLTGMSLAFRQSPPSLEVLRDSAATSATLLTDDLELVRSLRANRAGAHIQCLYIDSAETPSLAEAILAGADDGIGCNVDRNSLRAKLMVASRHAHMQASFRALLREHRSLSTIDGLTKVANRRFFARHFRLEVDRAQRYRRPMSLVICDIDHFKKVNDTHGHIAGDEVLREFGSRLQQALRQGTDWVARLGGEEFAIVLPETSMADASQAASKLRERVRATPFATRAGAIAVTASFGVCEYPATIARTTDAAVRLQEAADAALYRSKHNGRDRVTVASLAAGGMPHATGRPDSA